MELWLVVILLFQAVYAQDSFPNLTAFNSTRANMVWNGVSGKTHSLHKRGIFQLSGAIKCSTGRHALMYIGYGCYCGLGGQGWPRDRVDWCCHGHDCCYDKAVAQGCNPYSGTYRWTCKRKTVECGASSNKCKKNLCQCDKELAKCLRDAPFNRYNMLWSDAFCGKTFPTCN